MFSAIIASFVDGSIFQIQNKYESNKNAKGKRLSSYGIVRASIGIYDNKEDIDTLVQALKNVSTNGASLKYRSNQSEEIYEPVL